MEVIDQQITDSGMLSTVYIAFVHLVGGYCEVCVV